MRASQRGQISRTAERSRQKPEKIKSSSSFPPGKQKFPRWDNKVSPRGNYCFPQGKLLKLRMLLSFIPYNPDKSA
ncbi:hypothetical protein HMPREF1981_01364 [Bacteroides pyogenes F0041]|uniref:Uncharacterized protein n=2 Tax=Bacteroides pyogenes TaxID=310300 RepID=U2DVW6_9BACE|nr:hypothetical protein HMPREF1981_01364 [Bacteroides pyogenes F0041]GAE19179.1 hypothetical protein JCM6294_2200 [Bacteroides pyogenes DSM 20611 = JCM 6294]